MQIQKLSLQNLDEIKYIFDEQFQQEAWTQKQIIDSFNNSSTSFYGVFQNQTLVSFASILISPDDVNLLHIATLNAYKKNGYARALLKFLLGLKEHNQTFSLEVKSKNKPAICLYESFGFKTLHIRKKYYKDGDDALCMFLSI